MKSKYQDALNDLFNDATNGEDIFIKQKYRKAIESNRDDLQELIDKHEKMKEMLNKEIQTLSCYTSFDRYEMGYESGLNFALDYLTTESSCEDEKQSNVVAKEEVK